MREGFGPAPSDVTVFVDSPWEDLATPRSEWGVGEKMGRVGEGIHIDM